MSDEKKLPFQSFAFTLLENKQPRKSFHLLAGSDGMYELRVQQGSAANPSAQFSRMVPLEVVERLRDDLQSIGVFGWGESYGDTAAPGSRRWTIATVFQEGVFAVESKGGSDVPPGFDLLLEALYRMDFPRPASKGKRAVTSTAMPAHTGASIGDLAAFASQANIGFPGVDPAEMQRLMAQAQSNPEVLGRRMKDEFAHLSPTEQSAMLDALAATGLATRDWWERFFRG